MPDDAVKISKSAVRSLFGLDGTKNGDPDKGIDSVRSMQRFTASEISAYSNALYVTPEYRRPNLQGSEIISYLNPVHKTIGDKRISVEKMRQAAPEIEQSRILVSSSILSPNDLQEGEFIFSFENIPAIYSDPTLSEDIAEVFDQFFNEELQLGIKSYDWIGDIQYGGGSKPILILPIATQLDLRYRDGDDIKKDLKDEAEIYPFRGKTPNAGMESFDAYLKHFSPDDDYIYSGEAGKKLTWKAALEGINPSQELVDLVPSMESFGVRVPTSFKDRSSPAMLDDAEYSGDYVGGLESMIVNLRTRLEEGDLIKLSENPEIIRFNTEYKLKSKAELTEALLKKYDKNQNHFIIREELVDLKTNPAKFKHQSHPTIIELPPESVVPICIPGAPDQHLGYFVMIDQFGQPLTIENSGMMDNSKDCDTCGGAGNVNAAYEALFGTGCCTHYGLRHPGNIQAAGNMIFNHMLDKYLKSRMNGIFNRVDLSIGRFNAVATTLFYRLLARKETMIVFVPPELLHYFAFSYDPATGVGISKLNDIGFLLSMRLHYVIANIIALANDAVQQKIINVSVDEKAANLEGLLDAIGNIFVAKQKLNSSIDPSEIIRNIYSSSVAVVPRNVPGLGEFSIEPTTQNTQSVRPDNELLEQLNNLLVSHLDVPPSALNQLSEPEYAKSLVTYNLFFAKKIARYQRIWCAQIEEFIRDYATFSIPFQKALAKKLVGNMKIRSTPAGKTSKGKPSDKKAIKGKSALQQEKLPPNVKRMLEDNPNTYSEVSADKLVQAIIAGVTVKLPTPNIVVDNAQFEQIRNYVSNLNELADNFFPTDMISSDDQEAQNGLNIHKAIWKRKQLGEFIGQKVGTFTMAKVPDEEDINIPEYLDLVQIYQNTNRAVTQQREAIAAVGNAEGGFGEGGDTFGGGDEGGFGGDMGMDMGGGETDDGFDMEMPVEGEGEGESEGESGEEPTGPTLMARYLNSIRPGK